MYSLSNGPKPVSHLRLISTALLGAVFLVASMASFAEKDEDHELTSVKKRLLELEAAVASLQTGEQPIEVTVNCGAGEKVGDALSAHADGHGLLTIRVSGSCEEAILITRDNVKLVGNEPGASIHAPGAPYYTVTVMVTGAKNVTLQDLTLRGSTTATLAANKAAHVVATNIVTEQSTSGVLALDNAVIDLTGSTVRNNNQGVYAVHGGVVSISNTVIENNVTGVLAWKAGIVVLTSSAPDISVSTAGSTVRNNTNGAVARSGGFLEFADATIENNTANGVVADTGASIHFFITLNGHGNVVRNNPGLGVFVNKTASIVVQDLTNVITGNGRGILCQNNPGYQVPPGFAISGNTFGDIVGCTP